MPETPRMSLPYPTKDDSDWYEGIKAFFLQADAHTYAHREDRNLIMYSGATWSWDAGTGILSWDASFSFTGAQTGGRWTIPAGSLSILDGYMMVVKLPRYPQGTVSIQSVEMKAACDQDDEGVVVCVRVGTVLYFRTGIGLASGSSINIFAPGGGGGGGDVEIHQQDMHSNGIVRSSTSSGALALSVTDNGGAADDDLDVAPVAAGDKYYVDGKERTEPSVAFTYTNPAIPAGIMRLYRAICTDAGDPSIQERASFTQPLGLDNFWIVDCSKGMAAGLQNLVFTSVVAANFWKVVFDSGPPMLVTASYGLAGGIYRLYSQDGVNWVDVYFAPGWDWTKVDVGGPHTVGITFLAEVDEDGALILGSAPAWMSGGFVQWGYGASKDVLDQRYFGNLAGDEIRDDLLQSIAERAWVNGLNGVVFDRKMYWTERVGGGGNPMMQWPEQNFSLDYNAGLGQLTIQGGRLFVDGEVVDVPTTTIPLSLTVPGIDYYVWWDKGTQTVKITAETAFPQLVGAYNPLAYILGGSIGLPDHIASYFDKPSKGVPLYVMRRGATDTTIDEGTLCDLRRNVTKAALKNHLSVGFRPDWQTASFLAVGNVPDVNQTEAEFGCLDAAFRYMNAIPADPGDGEWGPVSTRFLGRIIEVIGYTEERRALYVPPDTEIRGCGYSQVFFHPNAAPEAIFMALGSMLQLPDSSCLKDLLVEADGEDSPRAAVALVGETPGSSYATGKYPKAVIENCTIYSTGQCALVGMTPRSPEKGTEVACYRSAFYATNPHAHMGTTAAVYFENKMQNLVMEDCILSGEDYAISYAAGFGMFAKKCQLDRCILMATFDGGPTGPSWPNGRTINIPDVDDVIFHDCLISSDHSCAVYLGGGKTNNTVILDGCIVRSSLSLAGSAVNNREFVRVAGQSPSIVDCFIFGPEAANTESGLTVVMMAGGNQNRELLFSRNYVEMPFGTDTVAFDYIVKLDGDGDCAVHADQNAILGRPSVGNGGLTIGLYADGTETIHVEETYVEDVAGIGIDVYPQAQYAKVSKCMVDGGSEGNGIRAKGIIEGCVVINVKSWGIHCYDMSRVMNNQISGVFYDSDRLEGPVPYGEYSAWGIRYSPTWSFDTFMDGIQIKNNQIREVQANTEEAIGNRCYVCGIGPERPPGDLDRYMERCDISGNEIYSVQVAAAAAVNTECHGICLMHPHETVKCDHNQIKLVSGTMPWAYGIGVVQSPLAFFTYPTTHDLSICHNAIDYVYGQQYAIGINAASGSRVSICDNDISSCWYEQATGVSAGHIMYVDMAGLGGLEDQIEISGNQMGEGENPPGATQFSTFGILVQQGNALVPLRQVKIVGNQMDTDLRVTSAIFIAIIADGEEFVVKQNQHRTQEATLPQVGIFVGPFSSEIVNAAIAQNETDGEYSSAFIYADSIKGLIIHDNQEIGFNFAGLTPHGNGIYVTDCSDIDIHDNEILYVTPDTALNAALINVVDCIFGDVHDNVLRGPAGAGNIDSLRFEDTSANPPQLCDDLHIHGNKIYPKGAAAGPYDIGFYATGGNAGAFGTSMTIWANVFGNSTTTGQENFSVGGFYVSAPAANNWSGAAFV